MRLYGFILGILTGLYLKISIALFFLIIWIIYIIFIITKKKYKRYLKLVFKKKFIIIFFISMMISNIYIIYLEKRYNDFYKLDGEDIILKAKVISNKKENDYTYEYIIITNTGRKFLLYTRKTNNVVLEYGDIIYIKGVYSKPEGSRNYKGFNYAQYLKTKGICGSINSEINNIKVLDRNTVNKISTFCNKLKQECQNRINNLLPKESAGILMGVLFGEKTGINEETILDFQESSLAHILAVSGAHVSYIVLGVVFILKKFNVRKRCAYFITIFILILFMIITGFTASVTRACIMGIILLFSKILYRKIDLWNSISIAVLITLILNPYAINDVGFILSYGGVIGIIIFGKNVADILTKMNLNSKLINLINITLAVQIFLIPIMMVKFNMLSFNFVLSNLLVMPLLGVIIILGFIFLIISFKSMTLANFLAIFLNVFIKFLILIAEACSDITFLNIKVVTPYTFTIIIYYLFVFSSNYLYSLYISDYLRVYERKILENLKRIKIKKAITIIMCIFLFIICILVILKKIPKNLKVNMIDVGQRRLHIYTNTRE
ncbi:MAG: ComEC family competence protein [Clostridiales bacterium]|nr:ComEC family competence protein [Clostridiales bacterium]